MLNRWCVFLALATPVLGNSAGAAQDDATELAKQLANPIASLISVPLQFNYDEKYGLSDEGVKFLINVQPVIPISLSEDWNVISRTILPLVHLSDVPPGNDESGLGDTTQSLFFSPSQPTSRGINWGVGPVLVQLFPGTGRQGRRAGPAERRFRDRVGAHGIQR